MHWRLMSREEIKREFPRAADVLAAVAEVVDVPKHDKEDDIYLDTCFLLHGNGMLSIPHTDLPFDDLLIIFEMLQCAAAATRALRSAAPSEGAAFPAQQRGARQSRV
jgi:hypothetical protein